MATKLCCEAHLDQPLDFVCLDSSCPSRGLVCYLCKLQSHAEHAPLLSLKIFLHSFLASTSNKEIFLRQSAQIDEELMIIGRKLLKLKSQFHDYSVAEETFSKFWKETVEQVAQYDSILAQLQEIIQLKSDHKQLNAWIARNSDLLDSEKEQQDNDTVYAAYLRARLNSLKAITSALAKYQQRSSFQEADVLSLFKVSKKSARLKLYFSQQLKGTCMTIHSPTKASMQTSGNQRMILLQPALSTSRQVKKWKVKIEKLTSWIGVGVSHLDSVKGVNFDFSYTNANHGNYLISSNGYSWNGYKMEFNSKFEPFQFTTGDVIQVIYDPTNHKVSFQKENNQQVFCYDIDPNQKPIHAAINMTGVGDCVEIIL